MQMQKQLSGGTTSNILQKPRKMLSFILHVLETANSPGSLEPQRVEGSRLEEKLRIVPSTPEETFNSQLSTFVSRVHPC